MLLYVHGKQQLYCRDSHLLNHTVPGQVSRRQLTSAKFPFFWPVTDNLLFLNKRKSEKSTRDGREVLYFAVCIRSGHATNRATAPGVWIPKMCGWEGAMGVQISC